MKIKPLVCLLIVVLGAFSLNAAKPSTKRSTTKPSTTTTKITGKVFKGILKFTIDGYAPLDLPATAVIGMNSQKNFSLKWEKNAAGQGFAREMTGTWTKDGNAIEVTWTTGPKAGSYDIFYLSNNVLTSNIIIIGNGTTMMMQPELKLVQ